VAYDKDKIFSRLGALINWHDKLETLRLDLGNSVMPEIYSDFNNSDTNDRESIQRIYELMVSQRTDLEGDGTNVVSQVEQFITEHLADILESPERTVEKVVKDLIEEMNTYGHDVEGNTVYNNPAAQTNVAEQLAIYDEDGNSTGSATLDPVDQMARPDNYFRAVCVTDTNAGAETWTVHSSILGEAPTQAVTGEDWEWPGAGIVRLSIGDADVAETDPDNVVSDASVDGVVRGTNADEDGKLYLSTSRLVTAEALEEDEFNQVELSFTTYPVFGRDTDADGKVHITVDADPDAVTVSGGTTAAISDVVLAGVSDGNTDDASLIYVKVTESGGTHTVTLWKNIDRLTSADKVASGSTSDALPATITLSEENSSGLTGRLVLDSYTAGDDTIVIRPPRYHVKLYKSSARIDDVLRAYASTLDPNIYSDPVSLTAVNDSNIAGTAALTYTSDDSNVTLQLPYYLIHFYSNSDRTDLVARAGTLSTPAQTGLEIYEVNDSGLSGQIDLDSSAEKDNIELNVGYSAGDCFEFATDSQEEGTFQSFFRDNIGQALPENTSGLETIPDSWAEGS
jgi:hypothetical protein